MLEVAALEGQLDMTKLASIQAVWMHRILHTARPLEEKMTLFWHNHFATANYKVGNPQAMYAQNALFRANALGSFHDLLNGVSRDPAMLRWLDSNSNRKASPNENYARELMELFTMDVGNYTETDVRESARAFTGWFYDRNSRDSSSTAISTTRARRRFSAEQASGTAMTSSTSSSSSP